MLVQQLVQVRELALRKFGARDSPSVVASLSQPKNNSKRKISTEHSKWSSTHVLTALHGVLGQGNDPFGDALAPTAGHRHLFFLLLFHLVLFLFRFGFFFVT